MAKKSYKRDYDREYANFRKDPDRVKQHPLRILARRKMKKKHGESVLRGKDIDHIKPLSKGGTNDFSNLRITSVRKNRSRNFKKPKK